MALTKRDRETFAALEHALALSRAMRFTEGSR